jgi:hypothetical protein
MGHSVEGFAIFGEDFLPRTTQKTRKKNRQIYRPEEREKKRLPVEHECATHIMRGHPDPERSEGEGPAFSCAVQEKSKVLRCRSG